MRMVIFAGVILASPAWADPGRYVVQCLAACTAPDGTTQPAGTIVNRILAEPTFQTGPGLALVPDRGQALYTPPAHAPETISPEDFLSRFTLAEQTALMTGAQQSVQLSLWLTKATAATVIDVTDPRTTAGMAALVSAGILSAPRSAQILDLSQASP